MKEAPGILEALPAALQFFSDGTEQSSSQNIYVRNTGRGNLTFTASSDAAWLSVGPASGTVSPNLGAPLVATANLLGVAPGSYIATVEIDSAGGTARIPVSLLVSAKPKLVLSAAGVLFEARQGNGVSGASPVTFLVTSSNAATVHWNAQAIGGEGWLSLVSAQGTAKNSSPATVSFTVTSAGLQKGAYYALIRVTSPDVFNSPQDFEVVLNIVDAVATPVPDPVPAALVFTSTGGPSPPSQRVTVFTSSDQPAPYQIAISTETTQGWLSAAPLSGTISTNVPAQISVSVNAANLKPGVYRGSVNISISNLAVRTVGVTLIVIAPASEASLSAPLADSPKAGCSPANLVVTQTGLAGNFSTPAAWPRTVAVLLVDDCGNAISNGKIVAEFSNGDAPLSLNLSDSKSATYATTWTPVHATAQLTITAQATAPGLQPSSTRIVGAVSDTVAPILAKNGTLHNLYPQAGAPLAPGTIVQIFGSGLAASTGSTNIPLPTILNGTSVVIGGQLVPLYYVSSSQINAQLPVDLVPGQEYQVLVLANNAYTTPDTIRVAPATPGIARFANGQVIAQHADFTLVTQDSPAKPGEYLVAYLAGMGLTDTPVGTGAQAPSTPLAAVNLSAGVAIDGTSAPVLFAGLTPGFVGLYQVNFQVPAGTKSGNRKLEIVQAGQGANVSVLLVQ